MEFVTASGRIVPVEMRRRKGTRHLRLRLGKENQIVASVPWHVSERSVEEFSRQQRAWLEQQLAEAPAVVSLEDWLTAHPRLSASGDVFEVSVDIGNCRSAGYHFARGGSDLILRLPSMEEASLRRLVRAFAQDTLTCRVYFFAKKWDLSFDKLSVRDQSGRWGSCSASRTISLNWRLVLVAPRLQDYVILHELAHLTEMNHGRRFWNLLDHYDPKRRQNEAELDRVSAEFMRIGRA